MNLVNKTAIVTGASTGIGRATAISLATSGATVGLVARSENKLKETQVLIEKAGGSSRIYPADLSNLDSINHLIQLLKTDLKTVDILCNIAGIWHGADEVYADKDFVTFDQQVVLDTFMVGTIAPTLLVHSLLPLMPPGSHIINLSGTFENGAKGWLPYYVSKRAIEDLTVGLSQELKDKPIYVNGISPSDTATESYAKFFPQYLDESIDPQEIAGFIANLCTKTDTTGQIFVLKKNQPPTPHFHA